MEKLCDLASDKHFDTLRQTPVWIVDDKLFSYLPLWYQLMDEGFRLFEFDKCETAEGTINIINNGEGNKSFPETMTLPRIMLIDATVPSKEATIEKGVSNGIELAQIIQKLSPTTRIITWSAYLLYDIQKGDVRVGWGWFNKGDSGFLNLQLVMKTLGYLLPYEDKNRRVNLNTIEPEDLGSYIRNYWSKFV